MTISAVAALIKLKLITYWTGLVDETLVHSAEEECWHCSFVLVVHVLDALLALLEVFEVLVRHLLEEVVIFEFLSRRLFWDFEYWGRRATKH